MLFPVFGSWLYFRDMDLISLVIAVGAGFMSGIINTLAGSGSIFTLPVLLFLGLPAHIANGTNRVGILTQTFVGGWLLYMKDGASKLKTDVKYFIPTIIGSACGALVAVEIDEQLLKYTIAGVMLFLLLILVVRYSDMLREFDAPVSKIRQQLGYPLLFIVGFYGGFIQMGVGIFTLAALILFLNMTLKHANALKNMMNFFLTIPAFIIFAFNGQINWKIGFTIAAGQTFGAWVAVRFISDSQPAQKWIRWLLILMIVLTAGQLLGVFNYLSLLKSQLSG